MQDINALLQEIRNNYIAELPSRLDDIESNILTLEKDPDNREIFEELYRQVHSLKGSAGTHGLHIHSTICHNLEDRITEASQESGDIKPDINNWLKHLDLLRSALDLVNNNGDDFTSIERDLEELRNPDNEQQFYGLIVDTSNLNIQICKQVFESYPIKFSECSNGIEALQRLLMEPFDLLITSAELPVLNGTALIAALNLSGKRKTSVKTIMLTSNENTRINRDIDPDMIVLKGKNLIRELAETSVGVMDELRKRKG